MQPGRRFAQLLCLAGLLGAPLADAQPLVPSGHDAAVAQEWFGLALELVQNTPGYSPPVAARAFGYMGVALHEAVAPGTPGTRSLAGQLNDLQALPRPEAGETYHWGAVANGALSTITRLLFPTAAPERWARLEALGSSLDNSFRANRADDLIDRSAAYGRLVANAVHTWSLSDGGHDGHLRGFPEDYTPPSGPEAWVPTGPAFSRALLPNWGENRPFALSSGDACPIAPAPTADLHAEALEVYRVGENLTTEQRDVALFWADDPGKTATPPGHWVSILNGLVAEKGLGLDRAAGAYARLGVALADSFIGCWKAKYEFNLLRPVTYIQRGIAPGWQALLATPPFPEYPSGHSVQSAAAAVVLEDLFGQGHAFTDRTHDGRGLGARSFRSFRHAAEEAAISRLYGGIHFRAAIERGMEQGRCIGARAVGLELGGPR